MNNIIGPISRSTWNYLVNLRGNISWYEEQPEKERFARALRLTKALYREALEDSRTAA